MSELKVLVSVALLVWLAACSSNSKVDPGKMSVSFPKLNAIKIPTIFGPIEFDFGQEQARKVDSTDKLSQTAAASPPGQGTVAVPSPDSLRFQQFEFNTGPLPEGCKPFDSGRYGKLLFPDDGAAVEAVQKAVERLISQDGFAPDEAVIALEIYKATAFRSSCSSRTLAKLVPGSKINGWLMTASTIKKFADNGQGEIDVTPRITIVALNKKVFEGHLKPTAANFLLSRFRFEIPPNTDSLASDPKTGSTILAYSENLEDVMLGNATRHVLAGGVMRIFVGKTYIYLIDLYANTEGVSQKQVDANQKYIDSFKYVGAADGN